MTPGDEIDTYLCAVARQEIEKRYYARVNTNARLEHLIQNTEFLRDPAHHVALFPDHGVVHVRDVANQILRVLDVVHGVLIPSRSPERFHFMKAFGVLVAYVHDIGMFDFSPFGRMMHPEYAAQAVIGSEFDQFITKINSEDCGGILHHINVLTQSGAFGKPPSTVLREMLALSMCHSKTKVPIELLNDPGKLRERILHTITTDLKTLYLEQQIGKTQFPTTNHQKGDSYFWLISEDAKARELTSDVIDTLRALRAADSLRQRGTVLKTSGNYEIMVDHRSANAIWALRLGQDRLFLLESNDPLAAGEANIASSALERDGSLRIAFHHGSFWEQGAIFRAACNAARVVSDIQEDVIKSFNRMEPCDCRLQSSDVPILLEGTDDNLEFTEMVRQELLHLNPNLPNPVRCVPSLHNATTLEISRYLDANNLDWNTDKKLELIEKVAASGTKIENTGLPQAFQDVRLIKLSKAQVLIEANSPAAFVYIPLGEGLKVIPLGGYDPFPVLPWMPLGNTGVIRGAVRNADVIAEQAVELIMIPQEVYLKYWHHPYTPEELRQLLTDQTT